jgi:hypothetical protein
LEDWPKWTTHLANTSEHGKIIAATAKAALAPIGCIRKGQSRVWYSDQRYWLIAVEFQPSGWAKGSYLNIFVAWLWAETRGYDIYYRPVFFVPFQNAGQFTPEVVHMAETAAREVIVQRERFSSFEKIYEYLLSRSHRTPWPKYNAAIAAGLANDSKTGRRLFDEIAAWATRGYEWEEELKVHSAALGELLDSPLLFRAAVVQQIQNRRKLMKLAPDPQCLDAVGSITPQRHC